MNNRLLLIFAIVAMIVPLGVDHVVAQAPASSSSDTTPLTTKKPATKTKEGAVKATDATVDTTKKATTATVDTTKKATNATVDTTKKATNATVDATKKSATATANTTKKAVDATTDVTKTTANKPTGKPGAGPPPQGGMVWVNTESGTYQKAGSRWYGNTKQGKYMTEADAQKAGYKPVEKRGTLGEKPGNEGGTPGKPPEKPGNEGGTPGLVPDPHRNQ